jgi:Family of unknown function (DUF6364)
MSHPTKLTLRLDSDLVGQAKDYAQRQDRSLSQIVGDYFARLAAEPGATKRSAAKTGLKTAELSPVTLSLLGALSPKAAPKRYASKVATTLDPDKAAYRKYLDEKYS